MDRSLTPVNGYESFSSKKVSSRGGWNAAIFIIFVEVADRFAYYGIAGNLIMYLINVLHQPISTAAKNVNLWVGVSSIFPLIGGLVADSFLGRFNTIGTVMLSLSVSAIPMHIRKTVFFVALYILSVGEGGHKPCVQTFAADQFDEDSPEEKQAKASFFNWWYLGIVFGSSTAILLVIYIQDNISWALGFWMLTAVLAVALALFLVGIKRYRRQVPVGSPMTSVAQVMVAAARKWCVDETRGRFGIYYGDHERDGTLVKGQPGAYILGRTSQFRYVSIPSVTSSWST
ncbi:hypothetical protein FEM48_Zijuj03G0021700 [Ziziphus jujuba var. spinosa]|uniref:Protein NRT1/ PTR FAMILY 5.4-like n=1 Tax=Ziziphus jujuba var. spinosa TaxID=714518 RepID=A0A978VMJ5_ZIZJJ|nr:hypothetical protein FEM48_Zijuj03G0021700 [Ziziphus jujuba var. spinosa]